METSVNKPRNLKQPLLYALVVSVVAAVVLGLVLVLRNKWSWLEVRVILTTITIACASILGLACDYSRTPRGWNIFPKLGLVLTASAAVMLLVLIWAEPNADAIWKTTACLTMFAVATAHVCLLSLARLARRFRWVFALASQVIYGLVALLSAMILWESAVASQQTWQFVAALSILVAGFSVLIPILHRISRLDPTTAPAGTILDESRLASIDVEIQQLRKRIAELEKLREDFACGA